MFHFNSLSFAVLLAVLAFSSALVLPLPAVAGIDVNGALDVDGVVSGAVATAGGLVNGLTNTLAGTVAGAGNALGAAAGNLAGVVNNNGALNVVGGLGGILG